MNIKKGKQFFFSSKTFKNKKTFGFENNFSVAGGLALNLPALGFNGVFPEVNDYVLQETALESGFQSKPLYQGKTHFSIVWFVFSEIPRLLRIV